MSPWISTLQKASVSTSVTDAETLETFGSYPIEDVLQWFVELFYAPGNGALWAIQTHLSAVAQTLLLDTATPGGTAAAVLSIGAWLLAARIILASFRVGRDIDRALTAHIVRCCNKLRISLLTGLAGIANQLRRLRTARAGAQNDIDDQLLQSVSDQELLVLQLHARLAPAHALAPSEIAAELGLAKNQTEKIVAKLTRLRFLASALSGCDGEEAYKLTRAGRICLIARKPPSRQTA